MVQNYNTQNGMKVYQIKWWKNIQHWMVWNYNTCNPHQHACTHVTRLCCVIALCLQKYAA